MSQRKIPDERVAAIAPFGLRMPPDLRDRVAKAAERQGRSMNALIVRILSDMFPEAPTVDDLLVDLAQLLREIETTPSDDAKIALAEKVEQLRKSVVEQRRREISQEIRAPDGKDRWEDQLNSAVERVSGRKPDP